MRLLTLGTHGLTLVLLAPALLSAQPQATTFADVPRVVETGGKVVVTDESGQKTKGTVAELTPTSMTLVTRDKWGSEQTRVFEANSVRSINKTDSVWNGLLIGIGAGAVAAEVFVHQVCGPRGHDDECAAIASGVGWVTMIPGGAVVGALIDRAIGNGALYRKPLAAGNSLAISPIIAPSRGGAVVSIRF